MYKIKILLATYNGEKYIQEQVESILAQRDVVVDIDVSDDGSTDETIEILQKNFPLIGITINSPGTGSAANNFLGMVSALNFEHDFQYIALSDQDDVWLPQKMVAAVNCLIEGKASLYCSNLTKWDTRDKSFSTLKKNFPQRKFDFLFEGGSAGCTYVFTKAFAKLLQKFVQILDTGNWKGFSHDWLIYFFARSNQHKVVIDQNSYINYRLHETNVHGHLNRLSLNTVFTKAREVFRGYYQHHARNYILWLDPQSTEFLIYQAFLGGYFKRNFMIWKYNNELMRDNKKLIIFVFLNLFKLR